MCKTGPHFKLCTCSDIETLSDYWKLTRGNKKYIKDIVGSIMAPDDFNKARNFDAAFYVQHRLEFDLNNHVVFNFEYQPEEGDKIEFYFEELDDEGFHTSFIFSEGRFATEEFGEDYLGGKPFAVGDVRYVIK